MEENFNNVEKSEDLSKEVTQNFEYSINPLTPFGKMNRAYFFLYIGLSNILSIIFGAFMSTILIGKEPKIQFIIALSSLLVAIFIAILQFFVTKKRSLDIFNNNKIAWIFASSIMVASIILGLINKNLILLLIPFGLYLFFAPSHKNK